MYGNLQEAAYRLAQERLAKLQDEHQKNRDLQEYYGAASLQRSGKIGTIRNVGEFDVAVHLHAEVEATVRVVVVAA